MGILTFLAESTMKIDPQRLRGCGSIATGPERVKRSYATP